MRLFEEKERKAKMPAPHSMGMFEWLDICSEPYCQKVRDQLNVMFAMYPEDKSPELQKRIRSAIPADHRSGVAELIVHHWLLTANCNSLEVEPELDGQEGHPDFLAITPEGNRFYMEVASRGDNKNFDDILIDALNKIDSPYYLELKLSGHPSNTPSVTKLCKKIETWVAHIQPDNPDERFRYDKDGLSFELSPIGPKSERNNRTIGAIWSGKAEWVSVTGNMEKSIKRKANKYGDLKAPYVVIVSSDQFHIGYEEIREALYGTLTTTFNPIDPEGTAKNLRNPNGVWMGPGPKPRNTRLSAVIFLSNPSATNLAWCRPIVFKNPWAVYPINLEFLEANTYEKIDREILETKKGKSFGKLFGLGNHWPKSRSDDAY